MGMKVTTMQHNFYIYLMEKKVIAEAVSERGRIKPVESYYLENMTLTGISREVGWGF